MIYSIVPTDVVFFDNTQIRQRHLKMYNNVTLEDVYKRQVLDNIMYIALKAKQKSILGESNESL